MGAVIDQPGARKADLAAIHVARKALGWDDDTYRDVMATVCGVRSSAELDFAGRKRFLSHLRACQKQLGILPARSGADRPAGKRWTPSQRRLWSLWMQLADAGLVTERQRAGLDAWIKRQTGVDRLEWLTDQQLDGVISSAKRWLARRKEG